jgi:hypothetical protein
MSMPRIARIALVAVAAVTVLPIALILLLSALQECSGAVVVLGLIIAAAVGMVRGLKWLMGDYAGRR